MGLRASNSRKNPPMTFGNNEGFGTISYNILMTLPFVMIETWVGQGEGNERIPNQKLRFCFNLLIDKQIVYLVSIMKLLVASGEQSRREN